MSQTLYALNPMPLTREGPAEMVWGARDPETGDEIETAQFRFDRWPVGARGGLVESFVAGKRQGWAVAYYDNGNKACEGSFHDGVESGWWVFWNEDGSPAVAIEFERGLPCRPVLQSAARLSRAA